MPKTTQWLLALACALGGPSALATETWIGDFVWEDVNRNGLQDVGEPGIAGVQVRAGLGCRVMDADFHSTIYTDADGHYRVSPRLVTASRCHLEFVPPTGPDYHYEPTIGGVSILTYESMFGLVDLAPDDSDIGGNPYAPGYVTPEFDVPLPYAIGDDQWGTNVDAGFIKWVNGGLTGFVWGDSDHDGRRDPGEAGLAGVTVDLLETAVRVAESVVTDAEGRFSFTNLMSDWQYGLQVTPLPGFEFTLPDVGDDLLDNDFSGSGKLFFYLDSAELRTFVNAGLYSPSLPPVPTPAPGSAWMLAAAIGALGAITRRRPARVRPHRPGCASPR